MSLLGQVLREILFRRWSAALGASAVAVAIAAATFVILATRAAEDETRVIQRDIGLNVIILPAATDIDRYWALGYSEHSMPEEYIDRVAAQEVANRLIPYLHRRVTIAGFDAMLTGMSSERFIDGKKKAVFGFEIEPGTVVVGDAVAASLALARGDTMDLLGEPFRVERVLAPQGSAEDVRVYARLADVQRLLDLPERINEIQALECECDEDVADPLARLREQLEPLLPNTTVIRRAALADARLHQRQMAQRTVGVVTPVIVILAGLWTATLAALNVRERRAEIGVLRSLGFGSGRVASLWATRALLLGLGGAVLGAVVGGVLFSTLGGGMFRLTRVSGGLDAGLIVWMLLAGPAFACVASVVPIALAARTDPASLMETT